MVSIESPRAFKESIKKLKAGGLTLHEKRALVQAQNRATAQLNRKNLSGKERKEFSKIGKLKI